MVNTKAKSAKAAKNAGSSAANPIYGMGLIGAMVYYIQQADGFFPVIWAIIKAFFWPGFVIYDLLKHIG